MSAARVATDRAPAAIGPYSQAIVDGDRVWTSGQVALDPASGELVGDDVAAQTEQVMANLSAVLEAAGCSLAAIVRTTVYLTDMAHFGAMNAVYERHLGEVLPARSTVAVVGLPKGALVEIDAVARRG